mmetsp:Transcript_69566/g.166856  ORF Transcript_69566/g.166856 Transcript_69566/m.166856 type:complete len:225 (+) Transcript_69566:1227-1901(+)
MEDVAAGQQHAIDALHELGQANHARVFLAAADFENTRHVTLLLLELGNCGFGHLCCLERPLTGLRQWLLSPRLPTSRTGVCLHPVTHLVHEAHALAAEANWSQEHADCHDDEGKTVETIILVSLQNRRFIVATIDAKFIHVHPLAQVCNRFTAGQPQTKHPHVPVSAQQGVRCPGSRRILAAQGVQLSGPPCVQQVLENTQVLWLECRLPQLQIQGLLLESHKV